MTIKVGDKLPAGTLMEFFEVEKDGCSIGPNPVKVEDLTAVRKFLGRIIHETPVLHSAFLSRILGGPVYLKCENLQRTGSYKIRGAYHRLAKLGAAERSRGVVAASAGNHAQGVALGTRIGN